MTNVAELVAMLIIVPEGYRRLVEGSAGHPALVRALAATEIGPGLWLTLR